MVVGEDDPGRIDDHAGTDSDRRVRLHGPRVELLEELVELGTIGQIAERHAFEAEGHFVRLLLGFGVLGGAGHGGTYS